ncbi:histidinol-phosphate phosphatase [Alteribacillus persepolensis]|uniref:Histidinol-phosphatase n=1 Tax=Alteribacillus persepolensis TaxID=568899 RepID=A0A1G8BFD1_9BACI|nr:histidinol-phosphatase HisJ [Alteribacillus persepolensis]SDH31733.1 histidinol-phosphate phosphatase [Alteribacillus persepolensis]
MRIKRDGHIHTPYCPHGSKDSFKQYIERCIDEGFDTITFAEHAPLPPGFNDPVPAQDSAMPLSSLSSYITAIETLKAEYRRDITILTGLEIDYIEGFEQETKAFLDEIGPQLDDSILSVHFLQSKGSYFCLDFSPDSFAALVTSTGSLQNTIDLYFNTLKSSIESELGPYKPKRLGHMTLIKKFQRRYGQMDITEHARHILEHVKHAGMELDYNGAGTAKPLCQEPYPPHDIALEAKKRGIPLVYGSDAHQEKELTQGLTALYPLAH